MAITPVSTTLCEVSYDSDNRITPYRYQYWNSAPKISVHFHGKESKDADPTESSSGYQSPDWTNTFSLPSSSCTSSYLDYLRTLYECKSSCSSKSSKTHRGHHRTNTGHLSSRSSYNPTQVSPRVYPAAYGLADNRPKTACVPPTQPLVPQQQYSLPVLHHGRAWGLGDEEGRDDGEGDKPDDRLVWVDALSKWIPENQTLKKREALRKRANEAATERKQRKAYSSPLYSSLKDKRQKVRFQTPESDHRSGPGATRNASDLDLHVTLPKDSLDSDGKAEGGTDGQTEDETEVTEESSEESQELSDNVFISTDSSEQQTEQETDWALREDEYVIISKSEVDIATAAMEAAEVEHKEQLRMFEEMSRKREQEKAAQLAAALAKEEADRLAAEEELIMADISGDNMTMVRKRLTSESIISGQSDGQTLGSHRSKGSVHLPSLSKKNKKSSASLSSSSSGQLKTSSSKAKASKSSSRTSTSRNKLDKKSSSKLNNKVSQEPSLPEISEVTRNIKSASPVPSLVKLPRKAFTKLLKEELGEVKVHNPVEIKDHTKPVIPKGLKVIKEKPAQLDPPLPPMDMSLAKPEPLVFLQADHERGEDTSKLPVTQVIPTVGDTRTGPLSLTVEDQPPSRGQSPSGRRRFSIVKKEKLDRRRVGRKVESPVESPVQQLPSRKTESWIYGQDDDDDTIGAGDTEKTQVSDEVPPLPSDIPPPLPDPDSINKSNKKTEKRGRVIQTPIVQKLEKKLKRRQFSKDTSYEDELRKQELAEQRRQKHMEMLEKARARKLQGDMDGDGDEDGPNFDDYGFLAKYCILNKASVEMFKHTFDIVDDEQRGWLSATEVMVALRAVNNKLSHAEEEYLYRILELTGYSIKNGADFKLFSVVAALSQKIAALDNWMRNMIGKMDFGMLEMKLFMCKKLWECNVDHETNKISIDQLCVELRAGGVSLAHEIEVREKLSHLDALDLLDFLSYIPLFIMIHQSVVDNPLDDTRDK
ncbi:caldesmon-like isoform X6 [Argopecten irradians]|uniref:caldesmon-like isoform X6 n=1 Tax=Argopecten irradians TaxID=31199 RepID=UPI0037135C3E